MLFDISALSGLIAVFISHTDRDCYLKSGILSLQCYLFASQVCSDCSSTWDAIPRSGSPLHPCLSNAYAAIATHTPDRRRSRACQRPATDPRIVRTPYENAKVRGKVRTIVFDAERRGCYFFTKVGKLFGCGVKECWQVLTRW